MKRKILAFLLSLTIMALLVSCSGTASPAPAAPAAPSGTGGSGTEAPVGGDFPEITINVGHSVTPTMVITSPYQSRNLEERPRKVKDEVQSVVVPWLRTGNDRRHQLGPSIWLLSATFPAYEL